MTRLSHMEFVDGDFLVRYRATAEPQDVLIRVDFTEKNYKIGAKYRALSLGHTVSYGFLGSDVFAPELAQYEIRKPLPSPTPPGTRMELALRWGGIAPIGLRMLVEELRLSQQRCLIRSFSLTGSVPLDDTPMSVTETEVRRWVQDPKAAPRPWPKHPFELIDKGEATDGLWRVVLATPVTPESKKELEERGGKCTTSWDFDGTGRPVKASPAYFPKMFAAKREVTAQFRKLPFDRQVIRALSINTLVSFHHRVAPIERVELTL